MFVIIGYSIKTTLLSKPAWTKYFEENKNIFQFLFTILLLIKSRMK